MDTYMLFTQNLQGLYKVCKKYVIRFTGYLQGFYKKDTVNLRSFYRQCKYTGNVEYTIFTANLHVFYKLCIFTVYIYTKFTEFLHYIFRIFIDDVNKL